MDFPTSNPSRFRLVTLSRAEQCAVLDKMMPIAHRYGVQMRCCGDKGLVGYPITKSHLSEAMNGDIKVANKLQIVHNIYIYNTYVPTP